MTPKVPTYFVNLELTDRGYTWHVFCPLLNAKVEGQTLHKDQIHAREEGLAFVENYGDVLDNHFLELALEEFVKLETEKKVEASEDEKKNDQG